MSISTPADGQVLQYNGAEWTNIQASLYDLVEVSISTAAAGDVLTYNGAEWVNEALPEQSPVMTTVADTTARDAAFPTPTPGTIIYISDIAKFQGYVGGGFPTWIDLNI